MILITSAKYVNPELQAEFGKIPPAFLPLGGKRLYEHQVKLFNDLNEDIALSLPESYRCDSSDEKKLLQLGIKVIYVPDNLSLGASIVYAFNMLLPFGDKIGILHGDTLFATIDHKNDTDNLLVSCVENSYEWTYLTKDRKKPFNLTNAEKFEELENYIVSGYFHFTNVYELIKSIVRADYSFINGLSLYSETCPLEAVHNPTWLDFGLLSSYFHSRKSMTTERAFNSLKIENGYVTKCSEKSGKLHAEINWFQKFPDELALYIPRFQIASNQTSCYQTEYLFLNTLSELYVFGRLPEYVWKQIFNAIKVFLNKLHLQKYPTVEVDFDYKKKTLERLSQFSNESKVDLDHEWVFNGESLPSIHSIVDEVDVYLADKVENFAFIHGDSCFSNIMYDFRANQIKVFDPRGLDFENKITVYGDPRYDHAKMTHSVIGLYDFIISGFYTCHLENYAIDFYIDMTENIKQIQKTYLEVFNFENYEALYAITIHLFLSMLPLHSDNEQKQFALLANALRLYKNLKEGI